MSRRVMTLPTRRVRIPRGSTVSDELEWRVLRTCQLVHFVIVDDDTGERDRSLLMDLSLELDARKLHLFELAQEHRAIQLVPGELVRLKVRVIGPRDLVVVPVVEIVDS